MNYVVRKVQKLPADTSRVRVGEIFVLPNGDAYIYGAGDQLGSSGSVWSSIGNVLQQNSGQLIQTGIALANQYAASQGQSYAGAVTQLAQEVLATLEQIKSAVAQIPAGIERYGQRDQFRAAAQQQIDRLRAAAAQVGKESDRNILRAAETNGWQIIGAMNRLIDTPAAGMAYASDNPNSPTVSPTYPPLTQPIQPGTVQPGTPTQPGTTQQPIILQSPGGIDTQTLLLIAAAFGVILIMK